MVDAIGGLRTPTNVSVTPLTGTSEATTAPPSVVASDIGEAISLFLVKLGREQRDAAKVLRLSAESMMHDAERAQLDAMRSQARAELCAGLAGAAGSFGEAGVCLKSAIVKQEVAALHAPLLDARVTRKSADGAVDSSVGDTKLMAAHTAYERAQDQSGPKLDRLKALSAGISGSTRIFETSFGALASNAKVGGAEAEHRAAEMVRRVDAMRNEERDAQAFIDAGLDALKSYEQRLHEMRTAVIFR